ncbi:MAG: hypothetical protein HKN21_06005 [Candidatus Eisenbacteria bacterium]|uniref:FlgD Ig-like domain-containing protein n=1 Tax=Eiseniibacteriota bacterium TaxID=2212470 RepID=A0A7Y2H239_UNCEI|nr:hypothetical protein [Candidatus Eisenbacteria bacterium]
MFVKRAIPFSLVPLLVLVALFSGPLVSTSTAGVFIVSDLSDSGPGTLRDAMTSANLSPGPDDIFFAVDGVIGLTSDLPDLTDDGTRILGDSGPSVCAGTPKVTLVNLGATSGIRILGADNCEIRGLEIVGFVFGIEIASGASDNIVGGSGACEPNVLDSNDFGVYVVDPGTDSNVIRANTIKSSTLYGVSVSDGPAFTEVGGIGLLGNSIIGSGLDGILVQSLGVPTLHTGIYENCLGCEVATGDTTGNGGAGLRIDGADSTFAWDNLILANSGSGIVIEGGAHGTRTQFNSIGVQMFTPPQGNQGEGVEIRGGAQGSYISDTIEGNFRSGVLISGAGTDNNRVHQSSIRSNTEWGVRISNNAKHNVVFDSGIDLNRQGGIFAEAGSDSSTIRYCVIGGTASLGNMGEGIAVGDNEYTLITENVISGNSASGIAIFFGASNTSIFGNTIGLESNGSTVAANGNNGIQVEGIATQIGGFGELPNVISGNQEWGIRIGGTTTASQFTNVINNSIGVDRFGNPAGNGFGGIKCDVNSNGTTIGGFPTQPMGSNVIKHNGGPGVRVEGTVSFPSNQHSIVENQISDNAGKGIDLVGTGNDGIPAPTVTGATVSSAQGTVNHPGFEVLILVFYDAGDEGCNYVGNVTVPIGQTNWALNGVQIPTGSRVTATATSAWPSIGSQTSEFAPHFVMAQLDAGDTAALPTSMKLTLASANPSRSGRAQLQFAVPREVQGVVRVYSVDGRMIRELENGMFQAGTHQLSWDGRDASGRAVASGTYLMRARTKEESHGVRVTLLR